MNIELLNAFENILDRKFANIDNLLEHMLDKKLADIENRLDKSLDKKLAVIENRLEKTLDKKLAKLDNRLTIVELTLENEICPNIQLILECLDGLTGRSKQVDDHENKLDNHEVRICALERNPLIK